ncbi:MAG: hypothetical protein GY789_30100 [Hyphomicrobiales bacterium]|nr:hypothetical protein [Hyphomicrobiales bacterium]MCP5073548.1 hypothetical protein [Paracoccaceae bacterium]
MAELKLHSDTAWTIASYYSSALASETRDLAAQIDLALNEALEECALLAESFDTFDLAHEIRERKHLPSAKN